MSNHVRSVCFCIVALAAVQLLFSSCGYDAGVRKALRMSGENREALESVLEHYRESGDKEAYDVACFLIREMPEHGTYISEELTRYQTAIDTMYPTMSNAMKRVFYQIPIVGNKQTNAAFVDDLYHITSSFLIAHIDNVVAMWRSCFWLQQYSFEELCEYLFPYRVLNEPFIEKTDSTDIRWK